MSLESFGTRAAGEVLKSAKEVAWNAPTRGAKSSKDPIGKIANAGSEMVVTAGVETARLGVGAVGYIGKKTVGAIWSVLRGGASMAGNLAMNVPIPMPGGAKNGFELRRDLDPRELERRMDERSRPA